MAQQRTVLFYESREKRQTHAERSHRLLSLLPAVLLALAAAFLDPANTQLRTGDPWYSTLYTLSGWLFLLAFCYLPMLLLGRILFLLFRKLKRPSATPPD